MIHIFEIRCKVLIKKTLYVMLFILFTNRIAHAGGEVTAKDLLAALKHGTQITQQIYKTDNGKKPTIAIGEIKSLENALFWEADMDIDCDGEPDDKCNKNTDPWFQPQLSVGKGIYASKTPFYVIPISFDYKSHGISLGSVGVVIFKDKAVFGPFLDECGVDNVIGEASYAMAEQLGINPDPRVGGSDGPVTYIIFTGTSGKLSKGDFSNHKKAHDVGITRARELLTFYNITANKNNIPEKKFTNNQHKVCSITLPKIEITSSGIHLVSVANFKGQKIIHWQGEGFQIYYTHSLSSGLYIITVNTPTISETKRVFKCQ